MNNNDVSTRIRNLRKNILKLTQEEFASKIDMKRNSIAQIETSIRFPSDRTLKSICREFNVNFFWLRDGVGEVFMKNTNTLLDELAADFAMSDLEKEIMMNYLKMDKETRYAFIETIKNLFNISE